jgi:tRNA(Ile)-lysidine synthase
MAYKINFNEILISMEDSLLVALSGGADSVALLYLLCSKYPKLPIRAYHLNHGLRSSADEEAQFCQGICDDLGIDLTIHSVNIRANAESLNISIEEAGRNMRYEHLQRIAEAHGCTKVLTAHHLDDQAETMILNFSSGCNGIVKGIPERRSLSDSVIVVRPLLQCRKSDLVGYLNDQKITYCEDESNSDTSYTRNRIRHDVIPFLKKELNPNLEQTLSQTSQVSMELISYLEYEANKAYQLLTTQHGLELKPFKSLHPFLQKGVVKKLIENEFDGDFRHTSKNLENMRCFLISQDQESRYMLPNGYCLLKSKGIFSILSP